MPDCELLVTCPFFSDSTYEMAETYKEQYCKGNYFWCGRYLGFKALERELERGEYTQAGENTFRSNGHFSFPTS